MRCFLKLPERDGLSPDELIDAPFNLSPVGSGPYRFNRMIVAEGEMEGGAYEVARRVQKKYSEYETKVTVLGHIQRGGAPSCKDRVLASRLGVASVEALLDGKNAKMLGIVNNEIVFSPLVKEAERASKLNMDLLRMSRILSI